MQHKLTKDASRDILNIRRFTLANWGLKQSTAYIDELNIVFSLISKNPNIGANRSSDIKIGVRSFIHGSHIIYYKTSDPYIVIFAVLHQNMNPKNHLRDRLSEKSVS